MKTFSRLCLLFTAYVFVCGYSAGQGKKPATYIYLKSGSTLVGWLEAQTEDSVFLATRHGNYRMSRADLASLETEQQTHTQSMQDASPHNAVISQQDSGKMGLHVPRVRLLLEDKRVIEGDVVEETEHELLVHTNESRSFRIRKSVILERENLPVQRNVALQQNVESTGKQPVPEASPEKRLYPERPGAIPTQDVLVLKGGSIIKGRILTYEPLAVQTADSTVLSLNMKDVVSITRETERTPTPLRRSPPSQSTSSERPLVTSAKKGENWRLFGGVGIPLGALSESTGSQAGYASAGFTGGFEWITGADVLGALLAGIISINSTDIGTIANSVGARGESGSWTSFYALLGVRAQGGLSPLVKVHGDIFLGTLFALTPELKFTAQVRTSGNQIQTITVTQESTGGVGFAYGFTVGISISKFALAFRFATSEPEFKVKATSSVANISATSTFKQPMSILMITAGIIL